MADIFHHFPINASTKRVYETISTPTGLDKWWTKKCSGKVDIRETMHLHFEPDYNWTAIVSKHSPNQEFELTMQTSDKDWEGSKVGFRLTDKNNVTEVEFYHTGWKEANEHYRISNYCWAMYLRLLKRCLEFGEFVPYADRLDV